MKLQFLKENAMYQLKANISTNRIKYSFCTNDWIYEYFNGESPFQDFKYEAPEFELLIDEDKPESTDVENAKILYNALKDVISTSQASDERFWSGLEHGLFWNYMRIRCRIKDSNVTEENIKNHYFFKQHPKRALSVNTLSRLWWVAHVTYDKKNSDPFELLNNFDIGHRTIFLLSRNYMNNPTIARAFLKALAELEASGENIYKSDEKYSALAAYVNALGGIYILDYLSEDEIKEKVIRYYKDTYCSQMTLVKI